MRKKYALYLCENELIFLENSENSQNSEEFFIKNTQYAEITSYNTTWEGKAFNVTLTRKLDGTNSLSFELPRYYFDPIKGKRIQNDLVELIVNKSVLQLDLEEFGEKKPYFFSVNERVDTSDEEKFTYTYSCDDLFIEELSKNGYGIIFDEEDGLGNIHDLVRRTVEGTDWEYNETKTGTLYEYTEGLEWNDSQGRYDTVYNPIPTQKSKLVPEINGYAYEADVIASKDGKTYQVYAFEESEEITSKTVQNMLYNATEFINTDGWSVPAGEDETDVPLLSSKKNGDSYDLEIHISDTSHQSIVNITAADTNTFIRANEPYLFTYKVPSTQGAQLNKIEIYDEYPKRITKNNQIQWLDKGPVYSKTISSTDRGKYFNNSENTYYLTIKLNQSVSKPYFVFSFENTNDTIYVSSFYFFPLQAVASSVDIDGQTVKTSAADNKLKLLRTYPNGEFFPQIEEDRFLIAYPETIKYEAYRERKLKYFIRNSFPLVESEKVDNELEEEDTLTYFDLDEILVPDPNAEFSFSLGDDYAAGAVKVFDDNDIWITDDSEKPEQSENPIKDENGKYLIYHDSNGIARQGYALDALDAFNTIGYKWNYPLLKQDNNKFRTLIISKSNRFNILQEIAELFKAWPVFNITRDEDGRLTKEIYFKEGELKDNFSGFHRGVNLKSLSRTMQSDEVVTKMFVEDQETDYSENGYTSIRYATLNPWGENYIYNFQYYIKQKLFNVTDNKEPKIEVDKKALYALVKGLNAVIKDYSDQNVDLKVEIENSQSYIDGLDYCIAAVAERVASLEGDRDSINEAGGDTTQVEEQLATCQDYEVDYEKKREDAVTQLNDLKNQYENKLQLIQENQQQKEIAIQNFENTYSQYIKEGVWADNSYANDDTYYVDALKVIDTSSMPKTDWSIDVIDGSCLKELEDFHVSVGDKTVLVDNEFFGIQRDVEENFLFEVLISETKDVLDNPIDNSVQVRNYTTSFEEMFTRIAAATQTLELNEPIYDKAKYFTADGEVDADILQQTLLNNDFILANASDSSYELNKLGLSFQSVTNPAKKLKALADGVFISNETDPVTGNPLWKTGITADGINADVLTAGRVNTSKIVIYADGQEAFTWNKLGISAYNDEQSLVRFDKFGLYLSDNKNEFMYDSETSPWFNRLKEEDAVSRIQDNSIVSLTKKGFLLNVKSNQANTKGSIRLGYGIDDDSNNYGLYINNTNGDNVVKLQNNGENKIAGWNITPSKFYATSEKGKVVAVQIPFSETATVFAAGGTDHSNYQKDCPFYVRADGYLHASSGNVAGWTITDSKFEKTIKYNGKTYIASINTGTTDSAKAFLVKSADVEQFYVTYGGKLYANNAEIKGTITANKGVIGDCKIKDGKLQVSAANITGTLSASQINTSSLSVSKINGVPASQWVNNGVVNYVLATGGTVGGWNIGEHAISSDNVSLSSNISFSIPASKFATELIPAIGNVSVRGGGLLYYSSFSKSIGLVFGSYYRTASDAYPTYGIFLIARGPNGVEKVQPIFNIYSQDF